MNALRTLRWWGLAAALLLTLAGCGGGGAESGEVTAGAGGESAGFDFTLTSYARSAGGAPSGLNMSFSLSSPAALPSLVEVSGQLLVHSIDKGTEEIYDWALLVDEGAFKINTAINLKLDAGAYNFYFLLHAGGRYYAGIVQNQLIVAADGESATKSIKFTLNPVISQGAITVKTIQQLAEFSFAYNEAEIQAYQNPAFSIEVTDANGKAYGTGSVFNINPLTGLPYVYVLLPRARYHFTLKFYDGANLKLVADDDVDISDGGTAELDVQPIHTDVTYSYTPTGTPANDSADLTFVVPGPIVQEAGGVHTLRATAAIVGPYTPLFELDLDLADDGGGVYTADVTVPGFTAGALTWSIQFRDTRNNELFAYCAQSVTIPDQASSETLICEPKLLARTVQTSEPVAKVRVDVADEAPVPGAVVKVNDEPIGITGSGDLGATPGELESFLPAGSYAFKALHESLDPLSGALRSRSSPDAIVGLTYGDDRVVPLTLENLPAEDTGGSGDDGEEPDDGIDDDNTDPTDYILVRASRHRRPLHFIDGKADLDGWAKVRIPGTEGLEVEVGDRDRFMLILYLGRGVKCWYLGGQWDSSVGGFWEHFFQRTFSSPACTRGMHAGSVVWVRGPIYARVIGGNLSFDETRVLVKIPLIRWWDRDIDHDHGQRHRWGHGHWHPNHGQGNSHR